MSPVMNSHELFLRDMFIDTSNQLITQIHLIDLLIRNVLKTICELSSLKVD